MTTLLNVRRAMAAATAVAAVCCAIDLGAQAGPPLAKAPRDTQPTLLRPKVPSPPPSSVAPRTRVSAPQQAAIDSGARPLVRPGFPPDSVRPKPPVATTLDPLRAPPTQPPPPAPGTKTAGVKQVAPSAALTSDVPPAGATARCKDGTFVSTTVDATTCSGNGGLTVRIPIPATSPKRPTP